MDLSTFPSFMGPVSPGNAKAFRGLGRSGINGQGRFAAWSPRSIKIHQLYAARTRDSEANLVWSRLA